MKLGDIVRINDHWPVHRRGPGLPDWVRSGDLGMIIEPFFAGSIQWGWCVLIGGEIIGIHPCNMDVVETPVQPAANHGITGS